MESRRIPLSRPRETLLGLIHPDDRAAMQAWIGACLAGEEPPDLEFRVDLPTAASAISSAAGI